jgi:hypothetical protein
MSGFIGVDFSGGARPWRQTVSRPTVWLAKLREESSGIRLEYVVPVQQLAGSGSPFARLVKLLSAGQFEAATIDAPFSLPLRHLSSGGHAALLRSIRSLPNAPDRDFPLGLDIVCLGERVAVRESDKLKPLRETERYWAGRGVNTRSTMWPGPRGGAPFAAACLRLLDLAGRPIWPWHEPQPGILGEAFPAAQLFQWGLPYRAYSKPDQIENRKAIIIGLKARASINPVDERKLIDSADALDAVIVAFAAIAISKSDVANFSQAGEEGFIAVAKCGGHSGRQPAPRPRDPPFVA